MLICDDFLHDCIALNPNKNQCLKMYGIFYILWNSMTSTSFVFTELTNTMKYGGGSYITLFWPSDVTAFHRIEQGIIQIF